MSFIKHLLEQQFEQSDMSVADVSTDQITVPGIGIASPEHIKRRVQTMINDLAARVNNQDVDWTSIKGLLNHSGLHAYVEALASLEHKPQS